jgi:lipopolysaccharide biosynthesis glycosyltransferase
MIEPIQTKFPDSGLRSPNLTQGREMEVLCGCDERYLPHAATMLCSLLEHNTVGRIHFFYSSIASPELAKLKSLVARYQTVITFYEMVAADFQGLRVDKYVSIAVYYRILAPRLLPADINKILYLDSDLIVRRSLKKLWDTDLTDQALAAVPDYGYYGEEAGKALGLPAGAKYFNSGVLLINLQFWRQNNILERTINFVKTNPERVPYWDQDALNAILVHHWIELPEYWNTQSMAINEWLCTSMTRAGMDAAIVHFTATVKPWHWASKSPFKHEYHEYRLKTPWWQYKQEGKPRLTQRLGRSLRNFARLVLSDSLWQWLRSCWSLF